MEFKIVKQFVRFDIFDIQCTSFHVIFPQISELYNGTFFKDLFIFCIWNTWYKRLQYKRLQRHIITQSMPLFKPKETRWLSRPVNLVHSLSEMPFFLDFRCPSLYGCTYAQITILFLSTLHQYIFVHWFLAYEILQLDYTMYHWQVHVQRFWTQ